MATRLRWPTDRWCGTRRSNRPSRPRPALARRVMDLGPRDAHMDRPERHVLPHRRAEQLVIGVLEHQADLRPDARGGLAHTTPPMLTEPCAGRWMPLRWSSRLLLPAPFGPTRATFSPRAIQVDAPQRLVPVRVGEMEVLDPDGPRASGLRTLAARRPRGDARVYMGVPDLAVVDVLMRVPAAAGCVRPVGPSAPGQPWAGRWTTHEHDHARRSRRPARPIPTWAGQLRMEQLALEAPGEHRGVDALRALVGAQEQGADHRPGDPGPPTERSSGAPGPTAERAALARFIRLASSVSTAR